MIVGFAARFLSVADHVDNPAGSLRPGRKRLARSENGIVEGMNFLGDDQKAGIPPLWGEIRIDWIAVDGRAARQRSAGDRGSQVFTRLFGFLQHGWYTCTQCCGKVGRIVHTVGIGKYRNLIVRGEATLDRRQAVVHLPHGVFLQALVDDQGHRKRVRVGTEQIDVLANVILVNFKIAPSQSRYLLIFLVQDCYRNEDVIDPGDEARDVFLQFAG